MNLEIDEEDVGSFDKINEIILEKLAKANMTRRFLSWPMPSVYFYQDLQKKYLVLKYILDL